MGEATYIYKNLPAGAKVKLDETELVYDDSDSSVYYHSTYSYYYNFLQEIQDNEIAEDEDILIALEAGITLAYFTEEPDKTIIAARCLMDVSMRFNRGRDYCSDMED